MTNLLKLLSITFMIAVCLNGFAATASTTVISNGKGNTVMRYVSGGTVIINGKIVSGEGITASGPAQSESRTVGAYLGLAIDAPADMQYTVSSVRSFQVVAPTNILPLVTTSVTNNVLTIGLNGSVVLMEPIKIVASGPSLESVKLSGSGDIRLIGLAGKALRLKISGSGNIDAAGNVEKVAVVITGSGGVDASSLVAQEVNIELSGSGSVEAHATKAAVVDLTGSGSVKIAGNPAQRNVDKSGSGRVVFR